MSRGVNWKASVGLLGVGIKYLAVTMVIPLIVAVAYGEDAWVFLVSMALVAVIGLVVERVDPDPDLGPREALLFVSLAWLAAAAIGTIPYLLAGYGTASTVAHPVNALFESMSGFTTTGATVLGEISTERHSHAILMWRQLTQWLGGMGIIVLMIAILPEIAVNGAQLMESEAPGPELQKLTPRIEETARALWLIYFGFTVVYILILYGLHLLGMAPNMDLFNAIAHGFTTLPTGGFSPEADSIAAFSAAVQWVVIPFMIVAGVNFALFWHVLRGEAEVMLENAEFRTYAGAIAVVTAVLAVMLFRGAAPAIELGGATQGMAENSLRQAAFQIGSLLNSTGFATADFAQWDADAQILLMLTMFIGGSAGSTGGGVKIVRWLVVGKAIRRELFTSAHPDVVQPVRLSGNVVDEDAIRGIMAFTILYVVLFGVSAVFLSLDAARIGVQLTMLESTSASLATIGNIGPGFGRFGPFGSYLFLSDASKLLLIFLMWIGRLEIVPVLAVFVSAIDGQ
ncbi:Trk-type transport system (probable substrate potassium) [Natronomonas moolapensis 8.8.11]|uniref:Trk-type transport system (Probable substrate potassium) n=1 Tax=Natronomonas moolapensis (strain DSM 18674 / CECT 7526 / JCM 14361 / 8.8.11) TaxID=268739 RepID=M1Y5G5_NATM8|nr:TrkH family potassium uptake protein [Natronomonas moolapensis]CCQ37808.1 Trk-type transport system (probable substrate potassium) [Natronomonas moolapensis 8.8.11]